MTVHVVHDEFDLTIGRASATHGEVRYTFRVIPGRPAVTWASASGGFSPAEGATVEVTGIDYRLHPSHRWTPADGIMRDLLAEVPDAWFLEQLEAVE